MTIRSWSNWVKAGFCQFFMFTGIGGRDLSKNTGCSELVFTVLKKSFATKSMQKIDV